MPSQPWGWVRKCTICGAIGLALLVSAKDGHHHQVADVPHDRHVEEFQLPQRPPTWAGYSATMGALATMSGVQVRFPRDDRS